MITTVIDTQPHKQDHTNTVITARSTNQGTHPLLSLSQGVFPLICSYLTLEDKLFGVIQLCHAVHGCLSPSCFSTNPLGFQKSRFVERHITQNQVTRLLSGVPYVELELTTSLCLFPRLTGLFLLLNRTQSLSDNSQQAFSQLIEKKPRLFYQLTEISFNWALPAWDFIPSVFPSLHTVWLWLPLDSQTRSASAAPQRSLSDILSLPSLTSLEIQQIKSIPDSYPALIQTFPWTTLKKLTLGDVQHFLALLPPPDVAAPAFALEYLKLGGHWTIHSSMLTDLLLRFPLLVTLDLSGVILTKERTAQAAGESNSGTGSSSPQQLLPNLRHLLLPLCDLEDEPSSCQTTMVALVGLAPQLTVLHCELVSHCLLDQQLAFIHMIFSMSSLRRLCLRTSELYRDRVRPCSIQQGFTSFTPQDCALSALHSLELAHINININMEAMLSKMPQLVDFTLRDSVASPGVIPLIGLHCEFIRSIRIRLYTESGSSIKTAAHWNLADCVSKQDKQSLTQCRFIPFSRLQMLQIHALAQGKTEQPIYSTDGLTALVQILHAAPLKYVSLNEYYLTCRQLILFASFPDLQMLDLAQRRWLRDESCASFDLSKATYTTDYHRCHSIGKVVSDEIESITSLLDESMEGCEEERNLFSLHRVFRQSVIPGHEHADRQGREAYFYDLQQHIQQGCTSAAKQSSGKHKKRS